MNGSNEVPKPGNWKAALVLIVVGGFFGALGTRSWGTGIGLVAISLAAAGLAYRRYFLGLIFKKGA